MSACYVEGCTQSSHGHMTAELMDQITARSTGIGRKTIRDAARATRKKSSGSIKKNQIRRKRKQHRKNRKAGRR